MPRPAGGEAYETSSATDPEMHQTHTASPQASDRDSNPKKRCLASSAFTRRKRAVTACQFCRLRKAKCDAVRPICGFCRHHNANCTYDRHDVLNDAVADGSESGKTDLSEQILHRLAEIKVLLQDQQVQRTRAAAAKSPSLTASTPVLNSAEDFGSIPLPLGSLQSPHPGSQPPYPATRCESILRWPVFGAFHDTYAEIQSFLFTSSCDESSVCDSPQAHSSSIRNISQYSTTRTIDEDAIVLLCRKFLVYVYPRNPILEKEELMTYAKDIAANGLRWNASSCLVLLACALACYARPWQKNQATTPYTDSGLDAFDTPFVSPEDGLTAEAYYQAAKKRVGLLGSSLLDIQCLFFGSVYERYALRPLDAWYYIQMACTRLQAHLMGKRRGNGQPGASANDSALHLEQRVFWTCFKAESELTSEIGLRPSGLRDFAYPDLFPTPPATVTISDLYCSSIPADSSVTMDEKRSWQFYLAEISLRRTIDDTLWLFYHKGEEHWLKNTDLLVQQYAETDRQISLWHSQLSKSFDYLQQPDDEFSFFLQGRFLDWRENALRPLLYNFLHHTAPSPRQDVLELSREAVTIASDIVLRCEHHHRHGGTWFMARRAFSCALLILAVVVKNGEVIPPPNWPDLIRVALKTLRRWGSEALDIQLMSDVLGKVFASVWQTNVLRGSVGDLNIMD